MWGISPKRIYLLQTVRIMNDACRTSQSVLPYALKQVGVCLHASRVHAPTVAPSVFCWAHNKCQPIKIPTASYCNLSPCPSLKSDIVLYMCGIFNQFICFMNAPVYFHLSLTLQTEQGEHCQIPSATSVRLGWVKKESCLWLLSLWITPQYGITLQWMSADTIQAAQLWTMRQRFRYRAAMEYRLI